MSKVKTFKPMKAVNDKLDFNQITYPVAVSLKMDGVYGLTRESNLLGRSLKPMKSEWLTEMLSKDTFSGFCGEVCYADDFSEYSESALRLNRQDLCRTSTSKVNTIKSGEFPFVWVLFDFVKDFSEDYCYSTEYCDRMTELVSILDKKGEYVKHHTLCDIHYHEYMIEGVSVLIPEGHIINTPEELEELYNKALSKGYEGIVARTVDGIYKFGRSTAKSLEFVRFKPEGSSEIVVVALEEMFENLNEAKTNELGYTERSTHKENLVPMGMVGAMVGIDIHTHKLTRVGAGRMNHTERKRLWENPDEVLGALSKYLFMDTGIKDAPRHPRHAEWRALSDTEIPQEVLDILEKDYPEIVLK